MDEDNINTVVAGSVKLFGSYSMHIMFEHI